jgi:hypothetical protein
VTRLSQRSRLVLALLCAAFVALRVAGAHLHLCFDGSEPPVSLHVADAGAHHAADDDHAHVAEPVSGHVDRDVVMNGDFVAKKPAGDLLLPFLILAFALALYTLAPRLGPIPDYRSPVPLPSRARLRPPLRGPPR